MTTSQCLLVGTCFLSFYSIGQVWLVQLSSYRLWLHGGREEFGVYHLTWWHSLWGVVLAPAILVFVGAVLMLRWRVPGVPACCTWLGLGLQILLLLGTALWWGPLMARIEGPEGGLSLERYRPHHGVWVTRGLDAYSKPVPDMTEDNTNGLGHPEEPRKSDQIRLWRRLRRLFQSRL